MKQTLVGITMILFTLLCAGTAAAERRYFLEGLEITIPDTWIDIDSQTDFLKNKKMIETCDIEISLQNGYTSGLNATATYSDF